jgi:hypothetical protein
MDKVIIATRGDDGWVLGAFTSIDKAKTYVEEEVDHYDPYECDYWEAEVNEGGSNINP